MNFFGSVLSGTLISQRPTLSQRITTWLTPCRAFPTRECLTLAGNFCVTLIRAVPPLTGPSMKYLKKCQLILQDAALADTTRRTRKCQLNCYTNFCDRYHLSPFPCSPEQAHIFVTFLSQFMAPPPVFSYISALWAHHRLLGLPSHALDYRLKQTLRGIKCLGCSSRAPRHPLSKEGLLQIYSNLNTLCPYDLTFCAAVSLAFRALLRKCHYTFSRHTLRWRDVSLYPDHILIRVNTSKTDQLATKGHRVLLNASPGSPLCPVSWIGELARVQNPMEDDYLLRVPCPAGLAPLNYPWVNSKLKSLAVAIGLDPSTVSTHTLRHGGASFMSANGSDLIDIRARGGWSSSSVLRYLHHADSTLLKQDLLISSCI